VASSVTDATSTTTLVPAAVTTLPESTTSVDATTLPPATPASTAAPQPPEVLVIAHRGSSDVLPEHTMAAYQLAIEQCADYLEVDVVLTSDGVLVARHENELSRTTDVEEHPEFADRHVTKQIDGHDVSGWFSEDFTVAELQTLAVNGSAPATITPAGSFRIATFDEIAELASRSQTCDERPVGLYVETKRPSYYASIGRPLEPELLRVLAAHGFVGADAPVFIQSFETSNLRGLATATDLPLVQLLGCSGAPFDLRVAGDARTYADLATPAGLAEIAAYADAVAPCKDLVVRKDESNQVVETTTLVDDAHANGLPVHAWTFQRYNRTLPASLQQPGGPDAPGDAIGEMEMFISVGVDGLISDNPDLAAAAARG
jgi:glycerophosphoryl diester phosphodiesterase